MDGFLIKLTNCLREVVLGPDTQEIRDQYFTNAEKTIRQNSYFNWFSSRIAIWKLRKSRTRMDQMWSLLLDPNFHKAVSEYVSQLEPVIEKIVERVNGLNHAARYLNLLRVNQSYFCAQHLYPI